MMEALSFPETSVLKKVTRRNIPEDGILDMTYYYHSSVNLNRHIYIA
jgi:hypothetical protein